MRILFLTELLPYPLVSGAKIRAYYVLRHLAARHQVTLLSFVRADDRPEHVAHLESFLHRVSTVEMRRSWPRNVRAALVAAASGRPAVIVREEIGEMRRRVEQLLGSKEFDAVHADQIPMAQYGLLEPRARVVRVLDQHNATFQVAARLAQGEPARWKRLLLQHEAAAFARYEPEVCRRYDAVAFVSDEDRRAILGLMPGGAMEGRTAVIPICVDTAAALPVAPVAAPFRVTHVGTMYWPPNVEGISWFWEKVWPGVRAAVPQARLTVIGKNPPAHLRALGEQPGVDVPGYVEDLEPYLAETAAFVVPLHSAGGMRVKVVDAWCWGTPVVSTTIGVEGISVVPGQNVLVADEPAEFAGAVVDLLSDAGVRERLRTQGRQWVEERYDWRRVYGAWDDVYARLAG